MGDDVHLQSSLPSLSTAPTRTMSPVITFAILLWVCVQVEGFSFSCRGVVGNYCGRYVSLQMSSTTHSDKPKVRIEYCPGCKWLLRSAWYSQELLTTFEKELKEVSLSPSTESGTFRITVDHSVIWDRRDPHTPGFPDIKELKQLVRDVVAPQKSLGHSDKA